MNEKAKCKNCTDEMIEEMKQILVDYALKYDLCFSFEVMRKHAEVLIKAGYRKIPEGSVDELKKLKVLVACEESQRVCNAFRKLGHEAYSCDLVDCSGGFPEYHIKQDVKPLLNGFCEFKTCDGKLHNIRNKWDLIIAHPPCTWFSNATMVNLGRKDHPEVFNEEWRKNFYKKQRQAFEFFLSIWNCNCDHIAIENVIGWLNTNFRKPTQIIQPYYFGEPYRKATCLWLYNLPKLEPNDVVEPTCKWVKHNLKAKNDLVGYEKKGVYGSKNRSTTFVGIAEAMATQWSEFITNARSKNERIRKID